MAIDVGVAHRTRTALSVEKSATEGRTLGVRTKLTKGEWMLGKVYRAALSFALSPEARRYEIPFAIGLFEAIRVALGHS